MDYSLHDELYLDPRFGLKYLLQQDLTLKIALGRYQQYITIAKTEDEIQQCFSIRYSVFVVEQKMFKKTDQDEFDNNAIHLAAIDSDDGNVISTVRCYKVGDNIWYGSRLAVPKEYRNHHSRIGVKLCKLAEKTVDEHGAKQFLDYIQIKNVRFFEGLRWR